MNTILWIIAIMNTAQLALAVWSAICRARRMNYDPVAISEATITRAVERWVREQSRPGGLLR